MAMPPRLRSLDVFRGMTIAGMVLVNNPGSWSTIYPPLRHASWHGVTPTDWIFPFFLFIVGVAIPFSLEKQIQLGKTAFQLHRKIVERGLILVGIGLFLNAMPKFGFYEGGFARKKALLYALQALLILSIFAKEVFRHKGFADDRAAKWRQLLVIIAALSALGMLVIGWQHYDLSRLRFPGVLQRIGLVYIACALIYLRTGSRGLWGIGAGLLIGYYLVMTLAPVPGGVAPNLEPDTNLGAWLDRLLFTENHLWSQSRTWDPEGLLSTLPAVATGVSGMLTGRWLQSDHTPQEKLNVLMVAGTLSLALGHVWNIFFPINKQLWTSSYVLYTTGVALLMLGVVYWLVDIKKRSAWALPFRIYGMNAIFAFVVSILVAKMGFAIKWMTATGDTVTLQGWVYSTFFLPFLSPLNASLGFAIMNVLLVLAICWPLYRWKVFIKV